MRGKSGLDQFPAWFIVVVAGISAMAGVLWKGARSPKIGVVDLDRVLQATQSGGEMELKLRELSAEGERAMGEQRTRVAELRSRIERDGGNLAPEELRELERRLEQEAMSLRRTRMDLNRETESVRRGFLERTNRELRPIFEKLRDEEGYDLILNNEVGVVILASGAVEVTEDVLGMLRGTGGDESDSPGSVEGPREEPSP